MKITANQIAKIRNANRGNWKQDIVNHLKAHNGASPIAIYNATRPDRLDIPESKKRNNIASQLAYLRDEGYIIPAVENNQVFLLACPTAEKEEYEVLPNMESRLKSMLK